MTITIHSRAYRSDKDFWRVRQLLIDTFPITPTGLNWEVRRWDGQHFHHPEPGHNPFPNGRCQLWETEEGQLIAAAHPEDGGDVYLQMHPDYRHIEDEIFAWAEETLAGEGNGRRELETYVFTYDVLRQSLLTRRGYERSDGYGVTRRLRLGSQPLVPPRLADGYALRTTEADDLANCQRVADLLNAAFNRDFHTALEFQTFTRLAPSYHPDLDLVAVAPDGRFAAYVGIACDEANRRAVFEPVCTHPDHRQRGLAQALMREGLLRLRGLGFVDVLVDTGDSLAANRLYDSIGFSEVQRSYIWRKAL